jgi:hypothetical protein
LRRSSQFLIRETQTELDPAKKMSQDDGWASKTAAVHHLIWKMRACGIHVLAAPAAFRSD